MLFLHNLQCIHVCASKCCFMWCMHTLEWPIVTALVDPAIWKSTIGGVWSVMTGFAEFVVHARPCCMQIWAVYKDMFLGDPLMAHSLHPDKVQQQSVVQVCVVTSDMVAHRQSSMHKNSKGVIMSQAHHVSFRHSSTQSILTQCTALVLMSVPADWWLLLGAGNMHSCGRNAVMCTYVASMLLTISWKAFQPWCSRQGQRSRQVHQDICDLQATEPFTVQMNQAIAS